MTDPTPPSAAPPPATPSTSGMPTPPPPAPVSGAPAPVRRPPAGAAHQPPDALESGDSGAAGPSRPVAPPDPEPAAARRPLLMDPAGARPTGFAPPTSPFAPTVGARPRPAPPPTPSRLAGGDPGAAPEPAPDWPAPPEVPRPESAFGPVSRLVAISIRTPTSRIDLVLPDRTTTAEVLETVLDLAPRSLREQALAHGGWILRTTGGRPLPGSTTLLEEGVAAGDTLVLAGADSAAPAVVYDDPADAVADVVRTDTRAWPAGAGRVVALAAGAAFGLLAILAVPALGPPWTLPALVLAGLAVVAQLAAGLLARHRGDTAAAVTVGLLSVPAGAAAAALATIAAGALLGSTAGGSIAGGSTAGGPIAAGPTAVAALGAAGPLPFLVGVLTAGVLAGTAAAAVGSRRVAFGAVVTTAGLVLLAGVPAVAFGLAPAGVAALVAGLAVCLMPAAPGLALRLAAFEPEPLPGSAAEPDAAARRALDGGDTRGRTRRAVRLLTALLHGVAWPVLGAGVVLALAGPPATGPALAAVAGAALLLRARLFRTVGQRVPLLVAGLGCLLAVGAGPVLHAASSLAVVVVVLAAGAAAALAVTVAGRRTSRTAAIARAAEIADLLLAIAVIPLTAAAVGVFAVIRGWGG